MERRCCSIRLPALLTLLALVVAAAGCKTALISAGLLWNGYEVPAEFDGLKDKKVVVVCKMISTEFSNMHTERALAEAISERLKVNSKKIHLIEPQKAIALRDEKGLDDAIEIGKQLKADKVIAIDIESFRVNEGQTLYRGRSAMSIHVFDVATKDDEWHKQPPQFEYPSIGPTPAQEMSEADFRNRFIANLADQIARYFYPHDRFSRDSDSPLATR
jgi:hypothetical protein